MGQITFDMELLTIEEIDRMVMERFPKLDLERSCATEKRMRQAARNSYKEKIIREFKTTAEILARVDADAGSVGTEIFNKRTKSIE